MVRFFALAALLLGTILVWLAPVPHALSVSFLDVGQGDAIFIESADGVQILIDGGADGSVLREIGKKMPLWDRTIDAVVATHPDKDHIGGLVDVFERYEVRHFIEPGVENDTTPTLALMRAVQNESGVLTAIARRGMRLQLGNDAYADILFPDRDVSKVETNTGSIIIRVVDGDTSFLLTGDAPSSVEKHVITLGDIESDVLKAGHHGSKTSSSEEFIRAVAPSYVIFSRGCDNTYGHPAAEVVQRFEKLKIPALDTCEEGTISLYSDGTTVRQGF